MKKISKWIWIAAGLLFLWAAADLYHYLAFGRDLMDYYNGANIIQRLVHSSLTQGAVKALLGILLLLIALLRAGWKGRRPTSLTAVTLLLAGGILGAWGIGMYCLTSVTAELAASRYLDGNWDRADGVANMYFHAWDRWEELDQKYENYWASRFWAAVATPAYSGGSPLIDGNDLLYVQRRSGEEEAFAATAIYDAEGNCLARSWDDFFYFEYMTEEQWTSREERTGDWARAFFDRTRLTEAGQTMLERGSSLFDIRAMRITGAFDGVDLTPARIEYISREDFDAALREKGSGTYTVAGVVQDYNIPWTTIYEDPAAVSAGEEVVTLYSDWVEACCQQPSPSFTYLGKKYVPQPGVRRRDSGTGPLSGIDALVEELGPSLASGNQTLTRVEGPDLLILDVTYFQTYDGMSYFGSYAGQDGYAEEAPEVGFYLVSGVYCSPWRTALRELRNVYLWTLALALALLLVVRERLRSQLIAPAAEVNDANADDWGRLRSADGPVPRWEESYALCQNYYAAQERLRINKNEITRLQTALDYARDAEQNRRQMVSNIAHELKTPLAVVHSYAEGLKEHIAEEKREKYLDVILSESEKMDAMVLEMLDLSRLEAGKVKLARDLFSLSGLAEEVFERLRVAAEARGLAIDLQMKGNCMVTADRSRIEQVVTNFATNAVKYATEGGTIRVRAVRRGRWTEFSVENDSPPLSEETLSKVWETFYRGDESRSGGGTGLGLAIARSIIELHGGTCAVRNTEHGVEFSFRIQD